LRILIWLRTPAWWRTEATWRTYSLKWIQARWRYALK
jgi:hypothetical protein